MLSLRRQRQPLMDAEPRSPLPDETDTSAPWGRGLRSISFKVLFGSTVLLWHSTFLINSLAHVLGSRRFETTDTSRNNFALAVITMGEGWHNNHHYYQTSTRQGFFWWELDISYLILKALSIPRIVWGLREPPERVLNSNRIDQAEGEPITV